MLDVAIRGGQVVDGSGRPRRRADVGIVGDRIVEIGEVPAEATWTIDATGKVVAPGFIDVHTHYDAQVFWDGALMPSPLFGFTTALGGNCGFSIAPLPEDAAERAFLLQMLARVEAIPRASLEAGVPWDWRSTGDFLDALEGRCALNVGFMVGHSAVRRCVMGPDASAREATADEIATMQRVIAEGIEAGGLGLSSSWARTHNDAQGNMVPSRYATRDELLELCSVLTGYEGTSLEFIAQISMTHFEPWAHELMADMSARAQRPLNWNLYLVDAANADTVTQKLDGARIASERGGRVFGLTLPKSITVRLSFLTGFVLDTFPGWDSFTASSPETRIAVLSDPEQRARLNAQAQLPENHLRQYANWAEVVLYDVVAPENEQYRGMRVGDIAADEGRAPFDVLCDVVVADELRTSFGEPEAPESVADWQAKVDACRDDRVVVGGSDAGAHVDMQIGYDYVTKLLSRAVRKHGLMTVEEAVHHLTDEPAQLYGLRQRGRLEEGWYADVVVFDPDRIDDEPPRMLYDLPGGAGWLYGESIGIDDVLVNGQPIVSDGRITSERPGTVLRSGRDTGASTL